MTDDSSIQHSSGESWSEPWRIGPISPISSRWGWGVGGNIEHHYCMEGMKGVVLLCVGV